MPVATPYRVIICDLRTDQLLDVLPVTGVQFDDFIGKNGTCSGTIEITDARVSARVRTNFIPARTAVYILRGTQIWWGGILWTRTPSVDGRGYVKVAFQAATFDSYFDHRKIYATQTFTGEDQLEIARKLLTYAQSQTGGDIGIVYDPEYSGIGRDRTYSRYDLLNIREQIDLLSNVDGGFEWRMRAYSDASGARVRNFQIGYPKIISGQSDLMLSSPGKVLSYALPEDGTSVANYWQARGASSNDDASAESVPAMSDPYYFPEDLDAGWPRLDGSSDYSTVSEKATLDKHAIADITRFHQPIVIPNVEVLLGDNITPGLLGVTAKIRIRDLWYYDGVTFRYRVIGFKVSPPDRGQPETAQLYLEAL